MKFKIKVCKTKTYSEAINEETGANIETLDEDIILFHNGTKREGQKLLTNGGRVLTVAGLAKDMESARAEVYANIDKIHFDGMYYRKDIGIRK